MSSAQKAIALQLRKLASDPTSQTFICQESGCMTGLLALLHSPADNDTLLISLQALLFLASHPKNKEPLTKQPTLILRLTSLTEHEDQQVRNIVQQILDQLQSFVNREKEGGIKKMDKKKSSRYLRAIQLQLEGREEGLGLEERGRMEKQLIVVKGVISVSVNKTGGMTVYTKREGNDIIEAIQTAIQSIDSALTIRLVPSPASCNANKENVSSPPPVYTPLKLTSPSSSSPSSVPSVTSRALVAHSTLDNHSLQSRFQAKQKKAVEVENKQGVVKGLFSSVSSFFW